MGGFHNVEIKMWPPKGTVLMPPVSTTGDIEMQLIKHVNRANVHYYCPRADAGSFWVKTATQRHDERLTRLESSRRYIFRFCRAQQ